MKRALILGLFVAFASGQLSGQGKFLTNRGQINFFSHTAIEDIKAENLNVAGVLDASSGEIAIIVKMTDFQFKKKLMQEHFNENYVESETYPKATFNGFITNNSQIDYAAPGTYQVYVEGEMTIHGESKRLELEGSMEVLAHGITARARFMLNPEDYAIKIPRVVRKNISKQLEISVLMPFKPI